MATVSTSTNRKWLFVFHHLPSFSVLLLFKPWNQVDAHSRLLLSVLMEQFIMGFKLKTV